MRYLGIVGRVCVFFLCAFVFLGESKRKCTPKSIPPLSLQGEGEIMLMPWRQDPEHRTVHPRTLLLHLLLLETATLRVHSGCLLPIGAKAHPVRRGSDCRPHAILLRGVPPAYGLRLRGGEGGDHDHASSSELPRLSETRLTSAASVSTPHDCCRR